MTVSSPAFFTRHPDGYFVGNDPARGPWAADACHAGPVTGLVARAVEDLITDKLLTRLSLDLLRPLPMAGLKITPEVVRDGRRVATARAEVTDLYGRVCATASSMHLAVADVGPVPSVALPRQALSDAAAGNFPVTNAPHGLPMFADHVEIAYPPGEHAGPGPTTLWMKTPELIDGEETSPFQRLCPLADCGNGISRNTELTEMGFMNCDLTIVAHRHPVGDWLASEAVSYWEPNGVAQARATLMDQGGPVATALQTIVLMPAGG